MFVFYIAIFIRVSGFTKILVDNLEAIGDNKEGVRQKDCSPFTSYKLTLPLRSNNMTANIAVMDYEQGAEQEYTFYVLDRATKTIQAACCASDCQRAYDKLCLLAIELNMDLLGEDFDIS